MKPLYVFLLLAAFFITFLADGIEASLSGLGGAPGVVPIIGTVIAGVTGPVGIVLGMAISWSINVSMGSGLLFLLVINDMYHPKFAPFAIVGGMIPVADILPFWVGLVISGIFYKMKIEGESLQGVTNMALKLQANYASSKSPFSKWKGSLGILGDEMRNERLSTGRPENSREASENMDELPAESPREEKSRAPIDLKSPSINSDIVRPASKTYAQAA